MAIGLRSVWVCLAVLACIGLLTGPGQASSGISIKTARIAKGKLEIVGTTKPGAVVSIAGTSYKSKASSAGTFRFGLTWRPASCKVLLTSGSVKRTALIGNCGPKGDAGPAAPKLTIDSILGSGGFTAMNLNSVPQFRHSNTLLQSYDFKAGDVVIASAFLSVQAGTSGILNAAICTQKAGGPVDSTDFFRSYKVESGDVEEIAITYTFVVQSDYTGYVGLCLKSLPDMTVTKFSSLTEQALIIRQ